MSENKRQRVESFSVPPFTELTRELVDSVSLYCVLPGDKLRAIKVLTDGSVEGILDSFIAAGGVELLGKWIVDAVAKNDEIGTILAALACLEKLPISVEVLRETKIAKLLTENLKQCSNQVAVERGRKLINTWKALAGVQVQKKKSSKNEDAPLDDPPIESTMNEVVSDTPIPEAPQPVVIDISPPHSPSLDALANLLDTLPDLEMIDSMVPGKKCIRWKPDASLVQAVEFAITDTCLDLRRTMDVTHGGSTSSIPTHNNEEHRRFNESRKKERAMAGKGLGKMGDEESDDFEIFKTVNWYIPRRVYVLEKDAIFNEKKLKSLERQDLANLHAGKKEVCYDLFSNPIPENPGEPSTSSKFYTSLNTTTPTLEVTPSGINERPELGSVEKFSKQIQPPPRHASFEDEFVKLNSDIQTSIMNSEALVRLFTQEPELLRDMSVDKIKSILDNMNRDDGPPPANRSNTPLTDDRRSWGVSTIRSSVRNQVMNDLQHMRPPPPVPWHAGPPPPHFHHNGPPPPHFHNAPPPQFHGNPPHMQPPRPLDPYSTFPHPQPARPGPGYPGPPPPDHRQGHNPARAPGGPQPPRGTHRQY
jgi:hypothetical protein